MMSDSVMVTTMISPSSSSGPSAPAAETTPSATSAVAPVCSSALPSGIIAPSSTMIGQSIA